MKKLFLLICITIFLSQTKDSFSQGFSIPGQVPELEEQISVDMDPGFPEPNSLVKFHINAYGTDPTRATIFWSVNGVRQKAGRGEQDFEVTAGDIGTKTTVTIEMKPFNGPLITKTISFTPQEVDLLWEARGYTPPFYRGKSFQGPQGKLVVVAIPNFKKENKQAFGADPLKYSWQRNTRVSGKDSGYQKNSFSFSGGILAKPEEVQVSVTDEATGVAKKFLTIAPTTPKVLLYENSPLYGILFNKTANIVDMKEKEISLAGIPFFFESQSKNSGDLIHSWKINGKDNFTFVGPDITLRNEGDTGIARVELKTKHKSLFLQEGRTQSIINILKQENDTTNFEF